MPITALNSVAAELKQPTIISNIFDRAIESSVVMSQARQVPLALDAATLIPVSGNIPVAGWVNEGGRKPVGTATNTTKSISGKKVALILAFSQELAETNAGGLYDQLVRELPQSLGRAFDFAAIHGVDQRTGGAGPFSTYLTQTTKAVQLGTTAQNKGGIYADLVTGEGLVVEDDYNFNGYIADRKLATQLKLASDLNGRPLFLSEGSPASAGVVTSGSLAGTPVVYNNNVGGKITRASGSQDTNLRAIGGDWEQAVYGVGMDVRIDFDTTGSITDTDGTVKHAFQDNLVFVRVEAYYGFLVADPAAFVKYTVADTTP